MTTPRPTAIVHEIEEHIHSPSKVAPTLASGITLTADGAVAWTLGAFGADIIAAGAVTAPFDIHTISVEASDTAGTYEIVLYYGATDIECGRCRFTNTAAKTTRENICIVTSTAAHDPIPANSRVRAKCAHEGGAGETVRISIQYHEY